MDSNTANTPIASKELTAGRSSASVFLTALRYSRPSAPASSCDRHVRIAAYETARRPSGVQSRAHYLQRSSTSSSAAAARQSGMSASAFFVPSHTHTPPADVQARIIVAQSPACVQSGEPGSWLAGWRWLAGWPRVEKRKTEAREGSHRRWWCCAVPQLSAYIHPIFLVHQNSLASSSSMP